MSGRVALFAAWAAVGVPLTYGSLYAFTPFGLAIIAPCLLAALALPAAGGSRWPEALGLPAGAGAFCLLMAASAAAVEALPSVGRCHLARYGDGGAHLHPFFFGRPARMMQLRGSPLLDWEENLPPVPEEVRRVNAAFVAEQVIARVGGQGPAWETS